MSLFHEPTGTLWPQNLFCYGGFSFLHVDTFHRVRLCCLHPISFGNLHAAEDFEGVWNGGKMQCYREFMYREKNLCRVTCASRLNTAPVQGSINPYPESNLNYGKGPSEAYLANRRLLIEEMAAHKTRLTAIPPVWSVCFGCDCNLNCIMCGQRELYKQGAYKNVPVATFGDFILQRQEQIGYVNIAGGEPFWDSATLSFLSGCAQEHAHFSVRIVTNGITIKWPLLDNINVTNLGFSVDAIKPATYEAIRRGAKWSQVWGNLQEAKKRHDDGRIQQVIINYCVGNINIEELPEALIEYQKMGFILIPSLMDTPRPGTQHLHLTCHDKVPHEAKLKALKDAIAAARHEITKFRARWLINRIGGTDAEGKK